MNPRRTNSSCLRLTGVSCLVALGILLVVIFLGGRILMRSPIWRQAVLVQQCLSNMRAIHGGLQRYAKRNGEYPPKLEDLAERFLEDSGVLHCPADKTPASVVSYEYIPPKMDAPPDTVVLTCRRHTMLRGQPPLLVVLRAGGKAEAVPPSPPGIHRQPGSLDRQAPAPNAPRPPRR